MFRHRFPGSSSRDTPLHPTPDSGARLLRVKPVESSRLGFDESHGGFSFTGRSTQSDSRRTIWSTPPTLTREVDVRGSRIYSGKVTTVKPKETLQWVTLLKDLPTTLPDSLLWASMGLRLGILDTHNGTFLLLWNVYTKSVLTTLPSHRA